MIKEIVENQRSFFGSNKTKDIRYRKTMLKIFRKIIIEHEDAICDALYEDFRKPRFESLVTETQLVLSELNNAIKNIEEWSRPKRVSSTLANFPSSDWIYPEPYGNVLIISPWNYPFMLAISPLIGALVAGNTAIIKPSELSPNTSKIIVKIAELTFPKEYVAVVEGGVETSQKLLSEKWNYIFFTGSTRVGKIVYQSAANQLTPVTLELGGKNPCIVDETSSIKLAAKRIAWGKFLNGGQTCVAPDYVLVHKSVKQQLVNELKKVIVKFYGTNIKDSPDFARIATKKNFDRLKDMLSGQKILFGGNNDDDDLFIEPTLLDEPNLDDRAMKEEIFGPILPIVSYGNENEIHAYITNYAKPLSLYVFSRRKKFKENMIRNYSFGGGVTNGTVVHTANKNLPFGGIGNSGLNKYHGKYSFDLFSHKKGIVRRGNWFDIRLRYAPYTIPLKWVKKIKHLF